MLTKNTRSGFTIVELLIVIVVIGILAAITIVAFNGIQQRGRDSQRVSDINVIKKSLELFHAQNGYYPNVAQLNTANFKRDTLQIPDNLRPPGSASSLGYCWANDTTRYCYVPFPITPTPTKPDCTGSPDPTEQCVRYTLSYQLEKNPGTQIQVQSAVRP
ncbi:MAG: prepilin-type N-terminal cleavage/methylation domain-containing protein [Chloroflexi bacterium]|nr:MAG: prepilin-type N-terminal cleavage/methylation domain-containing protein [Chloroflexota bacterium]